MLGLANRTRGFFDRFVESLYPYRPRRRSSASDKPQAALQTQTDSHHLFDLSGGHGGSSIDYLMDGLIPKLSLTGTDHLDVISTPAIMPWRGVRP